MARERVLKSFWQMGHCDDATNLRAGMRTPCSRLKCTWSARVDRKTTPHSRQGTGWGSSNSTARDSALAALAVSVLQAAGNSCQTARHARRPSSRIGELSELGIPTVHLPQVLSHRHCPSERFGVNRLQKRFERQWAVGIQSSQLSEAEHAKHAWNRGKIQHFTDLRVSGASHLTPGIDGSSRNFGLK